MAGWPMGSPMSDLFERLSPDDPGSRVPFPKIFSFQPDRHKSIILAVPLRGRLRWEADGNAFRSECEHARTHRLLLPVRFYGRFFGWGLFRIRLGKIAGEYCRSGKSDGIAGHHRSQANR